MLTYFFERDKHILSSSANHCDNFAVIEEQVLTLKHIEALRFEQTLRLRSVIIKLQL